MVGAHWIRTILDIVVLPKEPSQGAIILVVTLLNDGCYTCLGSLVTETVIVGGAFWIVTILVIVVLPKEPRQEQVLLLLPAVLKRRRGCKLRQCKRCLRVGFDLFSASDRLNYCRSEHFATKEWVWTDVRLKIKAVLIPGNGVDSLSPKMKPRTSFKVENDIELKVSGVSKSSHFDHLSMS
jgi:hypothetical protein